MLTAPPGTGWAPRPIAVREEVHAAAPLELTSPERIARCLCVRRRGRVAEGGGLLNRYTSKRRIEGSNPSVSANNTPSSQSFSQNPSQRGRSQAHFAGVAPSSMSSDKSAAWRADEHPSRERRPRTAASGTALPTKCLRGSATCPDSSSRVDVCSLLIRSLALCLLFRRTRPGQCAAFFDLADEGSRASRPDSGQPPKLTGR